MKLEFGKAQLEAQPYVGIRATTGVEKIASVMGPLFGELLGFLQQSGREPAGMPFAIYHSMQGDAVELECGMPVAGATPGTGRIQAGELPSGTMATVTHFGPYDNLPQTWAALTQWIESEGLKPAGSPWEVYVTDPGKEPDQAKWRTDIFFPVC